MPEKEESSVAPGPKPDPAAKRAADRAESYREAMEKIRSRTDVTAKGLATLGTAAVAGIGYAELADVYPKEGPDGAVFALIAGVVAMVAGVILAVFRFNRATRSVITEPGRELTIELNDFGPTDRFSKEDKNTLRYVYDELGRLNGVGSLAAYQARARRFERIAARWGETPAAAELRQRADVIMKEIAAAQDRAGALILRHRASSALFSGWTLLVVLLFAAGWYATALASDAMKGAREGELTIAKSCAEVLEKSDAVKLPAACKTKTKTKGEGGAGTKSSPAEKLDAGVTSLAGIRAECRKAARTAGEPVKEACGPLDRALDILRPAEGSP